MGAKLSVEEVVANLERRVAFHREQEAFVVGLEDIISTVKFCSCVPLEEVGDPKE